MMQKLLPFLEKNVQWFALGLGGLYVLWTVYAYFWVPPATVKIGPAVAKPGEVNKLIARGPASEIQKDIDDGKGSNIQIPPLLPSFVASVKLQSMPVDPIVADIDAPHQTPDFRGTEKVASGPGLIKTLPVLPAAIPAGESDGRTIVLLPTAPATAPARGGATPAAVATTNVDKDWDSLTFKVDMGEVSKAFNDIFGNQPNLPPSVAQTMFLQVQAVRQEQDGSGQWGREKALEPLAINKLEIFPGDDPGAKEKLAFAREALTYEDWAGKNADLILHPPFYQVAAGADPWRKPGDAKPVVQQVVQPFDPAHPPARPLQPEEQRALNAYRQQQEQLKRQQQLQRLNSRTPGGAAGARPPRAGPPVVTPMAPRGEPGAPQPMPGGMPIPPGPGGYTPYPMRDLAGAYPGGYPQPGMIPGAGPAGFGQTMAQGMFNPTNMPDVDILIHDDTVEPGKTYRYKVRYRLLNPLYATSQIAEPKLAEKFALVSPDSEWSAPVTIQTRTDLFLARMRNSDATFDVYQFESGRYHATTSTANPGDTIGSTGWVLVDIREDIRNGTRNKYVILVDEHGNLKRRDFTADAQNPRHDELKNQSRSASAGAPGEASAFAR